MPGPNLAAVDAVLRDEQFAGSVLPNSSLLIPQVSRM
jgi:hypothetical protein